MLETCQLNSDSKQLTKKCGRQGWRKSALGFFVTPGGRDKKGLLSVWSFNFDLKKTKQKKTKKHDQKHDQHDHWSCRVVFNKTKHDHRNGWSVPTLACAARIRETRSFPRIPLLYSKQAAGCNLFSLNNVQRRRGRLFRWGVRGASRISWSADYPQSRLELVCCRRLQKRSGRIFNFWI